MGEETLQMEETICQTEETPQQAEQKSSHNQLTEYYAELQKQYACLAEGNVAIDFEYLAQCINNDEQAKLLEVFLKSIPEREKKRYEELQESEQALGSQTDCYRQTWMIRGDGSVQSSIYILTRGALEEISLADGH